MKSLSFIIALFLLLCNSVCGQLTDSTKFRSLLPNDFLTTCQGEEKALLIDVRERFEFRKNRLQNAVNIPSSGSLSISTDTINKDYNLFFYCTSGVRSKRVAKYFYEKGFRKIFSLEGGIVAWRKAGFPVEKKRRKSA
jgi:thioredoxin 1